MNASSIFRISVLNAGLAVTRQQNNYPECSSAEAIRLLQAGPAYVAYLDYDAAGVFADQFGWQVFIPDEDRQKELQSTLLNMALAHRPFWANMSIYGRDRIKRLINKNEFQCLEFAGLFASPPSLKVVEWWDTLSQAVRENVDHNKLELGRQGEMLTLNYEINRLKMIGLGDMMPLWKSIEDNTAGYDVMSYDFDHEGTVREVYIEVKASNAEPCRFFLTRGEWDIAIDKNAAYMFHLWNMSNEELNICAVEQVKAHIANDKGQGRWVTIELPFSICE